MIQPIDEVERLNMGASRESPGTRKKKLNHRIEIEDGNAKNLLQSCCLETKTDRRLIKLIAQLCFSVIILSFSTYMLASKVGL